MPYYLTLVVPAYNEEERLPIMLKESMQYLVGREQSDRYFGRTAAATLAMLAPVYCFL